ncbi:MAG: hypothetical protein A2Z70_04695 [Chloroflexi bacterium RBG_13_48_17]|nr:MAG: hypothetical protein A2Z70_04695 [Chloroflexi bacterium RBG_13_48_17]
MQQVVTCPACGAQSIGDLFCTVCGTKLPVAVKQEVLEPAPVVAEPTAVKVVPARKFGVLRAIATIYRIIGWVVMVGGTLFSIGLAVIAVQGAGGFSEVVPWVAGLGTAGIAATGIIVSILLGLFLIAFADLCYVLIEIESNTRSKE